MGIDAKKQKKEDILKKVKAAQEALSAANESLDALEDNEQASVSGAINKSASTSAKTHTVSGNRTTSVENRTLKAYGVNHIKDLLKINTASKRYAHVPVELAMGVKDIKEAFDIARFTAQICMEHSGDPSNDERIVPVKSIFETNYAKDVLVPLLKAFNSTVSGDGAEWVPTAIATTHVPEYELERRVATMFQEMPMPTNPFKLPVLKDVTIARRATQGNAMTGNNFKTTDITWTAEKFAEFYPLPEELDQDSAPPILAIARQQVQEAQIRARENLILNADDSVAHQDTDVTASDDARTYSKGLRKLARDNSANGSTVNFAGPITAANLNKLRRAMGKYGVTVRELGYIFGPSGYFQAVDLEEVTTVEKFGEMATILKGALDAYKGIPISISEYQREDLDATGVFSATPANNTKACAMLVNVRRFWVGMREPIKIKVQSDLAYHDRFLLASYSRYDFKGHVQDADEVSVALGINIDITS